MTARPFRSARSAAGFTLVEMLVVMAILALLAAVALPALSTPSDGVRLRATANEIVAALRLTRAGAIVGHSDMALVLDLEARTLQSPALAAKRFGADVRVDMGVAEPERLTPTRGAFRFFPDGSSTGGDIRLQLGAREARICVSWLTGQAREGGHC